MSKKTLYEMRPYFYGVLSIYAVFLSKNSPLMIVSGIMMGACCVWVSCLRYMYRKQLAEMKQIKTQLNSVQKNKRDQKFNIY